MGYITNFIVYTLAMVGVIVVALLVFKSATGVNSGKTSKHMRIVDSLSLGQRKTLYIISTGHEQFLIAGDVNNTTLISKLENKTCGITGSESINSNIPSLNEESDISFKETLNRVPRSNYMDTSNIGIHSSIINKKTNSSVMRSLADILKK